MSPTALRTSVPCAKALAGPRPLAAPAPACGRSSWRHLTMRMIGCWWNGCRRTCLQPRPLNAANRMARWSRRWTASPTNSPTSWLSAAQPAIACPLPSATSGSRRSMPRIGWRSRSAISPGRRTTTTSSPAAMLNPTRAGRGRSSDSAGSVHAPLPVSPVLLLWAGIGSPRRSTAGGVKYVAPIP
jgi:hypothetical protein